MTPPGATSAAFGPSKAGMTNRARLIACLLPLALAGPACEIGIAAGDGAVATFERRLTVSGPVELEVSSGSGDIRVVPGPAGTVHVQGRARATDHWISFGGEGGADVVRRVEKDPPIEQAGNRIEIGRRDRDQRWNGVSISYVITVPRNARVTARSGSGDLEVGDIAGPVDFSTGSGDIRVGRTAGPVSARTGSGSIDVNDAVTLIARTGSGSVLASVKGSIEASSGSGDITVSQKAPGRADLSTGSGDINLTGASGPMRVRASSGDVTVEGAPSAPWEVTASSGDIDMRLPQDAGFELDLHSSSGGIDTALPVTVSGKQSRRDLKGQVRGGGPRVHASTGSGSIRLR